MYLRQTMRRLAALGVIALGSGCEGSRQTAADPPVMAPSGNSVTRPMRTPASATHSDTHAATAPPDGHQFHPRHHPPHHYPGPAEVHLDELPPMVVRHCEAYSWNPPSPSQHAPYPPYSVGASPPSSGGARASGSGAPGRGGGAHGGSKRTTSRVPVPKSAQPPVRAPAERTEQKSAARNAAPTADRARAPSASWGSQPYEPEPPVVVPEPDRDERRESDYHAWGARIYLSNDDTMSLSSAQRVIYAIENFRPLPREHIRPHELLNYFSFETAAVQPGSDFSVVAELEGKPGKVSEHTLALSINGRSVTRDSRRHAALTVVLDRSGSMADEGRMDYLRRGLSRMTRELKQGDVLNVVLFNERTCSPLENYVVGRDSPNVLEDLIRRLRPGGSTNLHAGLQRGYELAEKSYQPTYTNRVLLITDALANTGLTHPETVSMISEQYERRRIRLSGVGVGSDFNDHLLDRLTERGRGAYVFLGSEAEVDAVFGSRFTSLIETVANDVHFALHLPPSLRMNVFYGEESSAAKHEVQAIHYFAGTSQLFLSDLVSSERSVRSEDSILLSIEYHHPETGAAAVEEYAFRLGDIQQRAVNLRKGRLLMSFIDGLSDIARSSPTQSVYRRAGWVDAAAYAQCQRGTRSLREQASVLPSDPEVEKVVYLWDKFCERYAVPKAPTPPPEPPVRPYKPNQRQQPTGADVWPSARL